MINLNFMIFHYFTFSEVMIPYKVLKWVLTTLLEILHLKTKLQETTNVNF